MTQPDHTENSRTAIQKSHRFGDIESLADLAPSDIPIGALAETMGIQIISASPQRLEATMPVAGNTQPIGLLHGGASVVLAETAGSIAAGLHAWPQKVAVGIEINATHHRSATSGTVRAVAEALHLGSRLATYQIQITDDRGKLVCTSRLTCALVPPAEKKVAV